MAKLKKRFLFSLLVLLITLAAFAFAYEGKLIVTKDPSIVYFLLGKYYFNNQNYGEALNNFEKALEINPNFIEAGHNLGIAYYKLGQIDNAIKELKNAISQKNNYEKAYYSLALIYYGNKDYENAIQSLLNVIELNNENANAYFDLAVIHVERFREKESAGVITLASLDDLRKGLFYYSKVIELDSNFPYAASNAEIIKNIINDYEHKFGE